jgi:hypothetical protein
VSVQEFKEQRMVRNIGDLDGLATYEWLKNACKQPILKNADIKDINNYNKYEWIIISSFQKSNRSYIDKRYKDEEIYLYQKYGRTMICLKTGIRRTLTMGEWYGGGIVD